LGALLTVCGLLMLAAARAEEPPEPGDAPVTAPASPASKDAPSEDAIEEGFGEDIQDPAFDKYVDLKLLGQAWNDKDPTLFTDGILELAEGERVRGRPHKAVNIDKLRTTAINLAKEKKAPATLTRLAKAAEGTGRKELAAAARLAIRGARDPKPV